MSSVSKELRRRIDGRLARAGVIGLGYVGLPLAVELARAGFETVGIDLDPRKVASIRAGESSIPDVPTSDLRQLVAQGRLRATSDYRAVAELDTVNICVPTPLRKTNPIDVDCVAILTDHTSVDYRALAVGSPLVVDTRNAVKERYAHVFRLGAPPPSAAADGHHTDEEAA